MQCPVHSDHFVNVNVNGLHCSSQEGCFVCLCLKLCFCGLPPALSEISELLSHQVMFLSLGPPMAVLAVSEALR